MVLIVEIVVTNKPTGSADCIFTTEIHDGQYVCTLNPKGDCITDFGGNCPYLKDIATAIIECGLVDSGSYNPLIVNNVMQQALAEAQKEVDL